MQQCFLFFCYVVTLNPLKRQVEINEIFLDIEMQNAIIGPMLVLHECTQLYHSFLPLCFSSVAVAAPRLIWNTQE